MLSSCVHCLCDEYNDDGKNNLLDIREAAFTKNVL